MTHPVLIGFGDSWAAGHDLEPGEKCYLELTAEKLQIPCLNYAVGSSSIPHMIVQFQNFIDLAYYPQYQYHAVFFLTAQERNFFYEVDTKEIIHLSPSSNSTHEYYRFYTNELGEFVLNSSILALQRLCDIYNIQDYYVPGWQQIKLWKSIDTSRFWRQGQQAITETFYNEKEFQTLRTLIGLDHLPKNPHFGTTHDHPSQLGHERIAQELIDWIQINRCT